MNLNAQLTKRETEISRWIISGYAKKEIAGCLFISPRTVENTARNIYKKVNVGKATELCLWWFAKHYNIPLSVSPLKRAIVAGLFLFLFIPFEFSTHRETLRSSRVKISECRGRESRESEPGNLLYI